MPNEAAEAELEQINQQLEIAANRLSLPGLDDFLQPQLRPVGGLPLENNDEGDAFDGSHPPDFELWGVWTKPITARLEKWNPEATRYEELDVVSVPPPIDGTSIVLEPNWKNDYPQSEGRYRLVLETGACYEFRLLPPPQKTPHALSIQLSFAKANTTPGTSTNFIRHALSNGAFRVFAFPFAPLTLRVRCGLMTHSRHRYADSDGRLAFGFDDLGISNLPKGVLEVTAAFGAVTSQTLRFADSPYLKELSPEWELFGLRTRGRVVNRNQNRRVKLTVFGVQPWKGQIWTSEAFLPKNGWFDATLPADRNVARWLCVTPESDRPDTIPEGQPWVLSTLPDAPSLPRLTDTDLRFGAWEVWLPWAEWLESVSHPLDLQMVLTFSKLGRFKKTYEHAWQLRSLWRPLTPSHQEHLMVLTRSGVFPTIALFATTQRLPLEENGTDQPPATVLSGDDSQRVVELRPTADAPMVVTRVNLAYGTYRTSVKFKAVLERGDLQYTICSDEKLVVCSDCDLILPSQGAWHHHKPVVPGRTQCHRLSVVQHVSVRPAVRWQPKEVMKAFVRLMQCAAADGGEVLVTPAVEPYARRLRDIYDRRAERIDPLEWLEKIGSLAQTLFQIATEKHGWMDEERLQPLVNGLEMDGEGVGVLLSWLADWSESM